MCYQTIGSGANGLVEVRRSMTHWREAYLNHTEHTQWTKAYKHEIRLLLLFPGEQVSICINSFGGSGSGFDWSLMYRCVHLMKRLAPCRACRASRAEVNEYLSNARCFQLNEPLVSDQASLQPYVWKESVQKSIFRPFAPQWRGIL